MTVTHAQIVTAARACLGTPWVHQGRKVGRAPGSGIDCVGLLVHIGRSLRIMYHDCPAYSRRPDGVTLLRELDTALVRMTLDDMSPGRVAVFGLRRRRWPTHVGVFTEWDGSGAPPLGLVHTYLDVNECVETPLDEWWCPLMCAVYGWPGVDD